MTSPATQSVSPETRNGCQIVYRDERWWFIRPSGQWVGPYRTRDDAERKSAP